MDAVWGKGDHIQCIHPGAGCVAGRDSVLQSWRLALSGSRLKVKLEDVRIFATDTHGFVTCVEVVDASDSQGRQVHQVQRGEGHARLQPRPDLRSSLLGRIVATNIFEKQRGRWYITHHHGSPAPERLQGFVRE